MHREFSSNFICEGNFSHYPAGVIGPPPLALIVRTAFISGVSPCGGFVGMHKAVSIVAVVLAGISLEVKLPNASRICSAFAHAGTTLQLHCKYWSVYVGANDKSLQKLPYE